MRKVVAALCAGAVCAGCAKRPEAIAPAAIPMAAYQNLDCLQLTDQYLIEGQTLAALSTEQDNAATGDAMGVFLLGVPMSSVFGGNKEGDLAVAKGKVQAIESAMLAAGCERPPPVVIEKPKALPSTATPT